MKKALKRELKKLVGGELWNSDIQCLREVIQARGGRRGGNLYGDVGVKGGWRSEKLTLLDASWDNRCQK